MMCSVGCETERNRFGVWGSFSRFAVVFIFLDVLLNSEIFIACL